MPTAKRTGRKTREETREQFYRDVATGLLTPREAVRKFRRMLGMTQPEFAKYVGVTKKVVMAFEQGHANPTFATVDKMLRGSDLELRVGRKQKKTY